jgi:hypothetical protein
MKNQVRVEWSETRNAGTPYNEHFLIISELTSNGWKFSERSSWETKWHPVTATEDLIAKTKAEMKKQRASRAIE